MSLTDFALPVLEGKSIKDNRPAQSAVARNVAELAEFFRTNAGKEKGEWYWLAASLREGGTRKAKDVLLVHALVVDVDDGMGIADGERRVTELGHPCVMYPTSHHRLAKDGKPACDRFRLVFPLAAPVAGVDWRSKYDDLCAYVLGASATHDEACKDPCRAWYGAQTSEGVVALCGGGPLLEACSIEPGPVAGSNAGGRDGRVRERGSVGSSGSGDHARSAKEEDARTGVPLSPCLALDRKFSLRDMVEFLVARGYHCPRPNGGPDGAGGSTFLTRPGKDASVDQASHSVNVIRYPSGVRVHVFSSSVAELGKAGESVSASEVIKRLERLSKSALVKWAVAWCDSHGVECAGSTTRGRRGGLDGDRRTVDKLVESALSDGLELLRYAGVPYFCFRDARGFRTVGRDEGLDGYLYGIGWAKLGWRPGTRAITEAIDQLSMRAKHEGRDMRVAIRFYSTDREAFLHLGDDAGTVYRVNAHGWARVDDPCTLSVRFRTTAIMEALPLPVRGARCPNLGQFLNTDETGVRFAWAFLLACFLWTGTMPVLCAGGEQGSGKTLGCKAIRRVLDPGLSDLAGMHTDIRDLAARLGDHAILAYDNASHISNEISDALCATASGVPLSFRKLFRNDGEHIVLGRRPIMLTGIGTVVERPDLQDRSLPVEFRALESVGGSRTEDDIWEEFRQEWPALVAEVLDRVAMAFRNYGLVQVPGPLPRLGDLAKWVTASEAPESAGSFYTDLMRCRLGQREKTASEHPLIQALIRLAADAAGDYTPTGLFAALGALGKDVDGRLPADWPGSMRTAAGIYKRLANEIRAAGVRLVELPRTGVRRAYSVTQFGAGDDTPVADSTPGN